MEKQLKTSENQRKSSLKWKQENKDLYKRVPLDMKTEDYNRVKEYTTEHDFKINTLIKDLLNREINFPNCHLLDMITETDFLKLSRIAAENNTTVQELIATAVNRYIEKHK